MKTYDVLVVGAGLAGLQCARRLSAQNLRVLLIDRKRELAASVHTTGIFVRRTLEDFALPDDCLGPPVRRVTLYSPAGRPLALASPHDEFRIGRMGRLYEHYLHECRHAGVEWSPDTQYVGSEVSEEGSLINLAREGKTQRVQARYIVGADGVMSRVARDLGLDRNREWIVGVEDVLRGVPLDGEPCFHCFLDPVRAPGYLAWVVNDGHETHLGVGGYAARFDPPRALESFRARVSGLVDLRCAERVERRGGRIPVGGVLRRIANCRGLLVGDAAGAPSPLTAGGLDPCMRLSSLAADVVTRYLATGDAAVLVPYSGDTFRSRFVSRRWMRRVIATVSHPALLELICAALCTPLCRPLAWHVFFGRGSFPDVKMGLAPQLQS